MAANGIGSVHVVKDSYVFDDSIDDGACLVHGIPATATRVTKLSLYLPVYAQVLLLDSCLARA